MPTPSSTSSTFNLSELEEGCLSRLVSNY